MPILHPIFIVIFLFLVFSSYYEIFILKKKQQIFTWIAGTLIIIAAGFREYVGADYPVYRTLFTGFSLYTTYGDVFDKAVFKDSAEQIEWIFVLINKIVFDLGQPFYMVTFIMALISVTLKLSTLYKNVYFPALGILLYFMPAFFFEDSGQMRQGVGIAICVFSFKYIKERNLWKFLLCMYIALGFHKTSIVFLPAFWIVRIPMNSSRIFWAVVISILLSPLQLYRFGGSFLESITPQDISGAYTGYLSDRYYGNEVETGLNDIIKIILIIILIIYNKVACKKVPYYEYMRNLGVFGLCLFYLLRGNAIFAIRLPGVYSWFTLMLCIPSIIYAVKNETKNFLYLGFILYLTMMFFYFGKINGDRGNFTYGKYHNVLW